MKINTLKLLFAGAALTLLLLVLLFFGYLRFNYPSFDEYPVQGIDVSHHQGDIEWSELTGENMSFAFIKATEGGDYIDPEFQENWKNAKANGFAVGAYHFYRLCKNGREQADNFINTVPAENENLPPVIDLEFGGNCETDKAKEQILEEVNDFLSALKEHYGKTPIIYVTREFYEEYLLEQFPDNPIWILDIFSKPELADERKWTFWQFANRGHLQGVNTYVDINVFNGNAEEFEDFVKSE